MLALGMAGIIVACTTGHAIAPSPQPPPDAAGLASPAVPTMTLNALAIAYVKLVLALGRLDAGYVDAYYGPPEWQADVARTAPGLPRIRDDAAILLAAVDAATTDPGEPDEPRMQEQRRRYLKRQLAALRARAGLLSGEHASFDDEARALYDVTPPVYHDADFDPILARLERVVPRGPGTLAERYNRYIGRFAIPAAKLETVMRCAIAEARRRTVSNMPLPLGERFELAFVNGKPWGAYNWYQGGFLSRIEVNTDLPIPVSRVIELASHEGYPGHHVYNGLLEDALVRDRGWPEYQVYALFSPQSLLAEGTADFGVGLAFPGRDKLEFTRTLFRLAGFDPRQAAAYLRVVSAVRALAPAAIEAARRRLDGRASETETLAWLQKYTLASPDKARHALAFMDHYRGYVINYSYGETLVRAYVEAQGGRTAGSPSQWQAFLGLLSQPHVPEDLLPQIPVPGPLRGAVTDVPAFARFIAGHPSPEAFRARYPDVLLVLPGELRSREFRARRNRYFADLDAQGRIVGGSFR